METVKIGDSFGLWVVVSPAASSIHHERQWLCRCQCGTEKLVKQKNLLNRNTRSCGCGRSSAQSAAMTKPLRKYTCDGCGETFFTNSKNRRLRNQRLQQSYCGLHCYHKSRTRNNDPGIHDVSKAANEGNPKPTPEHLKIYLVTNDDGTKELKNGQ